MNKKILMSLFSFLLIATSVNAGTLQYSTDKGAIDGYDVVSYFSDGRAERGKPDITTEWNGAKWHFTTREHRDAFLTDPQKYAPQYGGYCALGMAHGGDVPTDPEAWSIVDGKLYLNMMTEVRTTWLYSPDKLIERADKKWQAMNIAR
jgi:hypothetical protein